MSYKSVTWLIFNAACELQTKCRSLCYYCTADEKQSSIKTLTLIFVSNTEVLEFIALCSMQDVLDNVISSIY